MSVKRATNLQNKLNSLKVSTIPGQRFEQGLAYEVELDDSSVTEISEEYQSAKPVGVFWNHFLPSQIICSIDPIQEDARAITEVLQSNLTLRPYSAAQRLDNVHLTNDILDIVEEVLLEGGFAFQRSLLVGSSCPSLYPTIKIR